MVDVITIYLPVLIVPLSSIDNNQETIRDAFPIIFYALLPAALESWFDFEEGSYVSVLGYDYIYWLFYAR